MNGSFKLFICCQAKCGQIYKPDTDESDSYLTVYFFFKGDCDKTYGSEFVYSDHAKELIVGEIFVRVYNEVPTFQLEVSVLLLVLPGAFVHLSLKVLGLFTLYIKVIPALSLPNALYKPGFLMEYHR